MRLILLGPPEQAKAHRRRCCPSPKVPHISTGDIFRSNIKRQTELGKMVSGILESGGLVPDDLTCKIVKDRLMKDDCHDGFILDGFQDPSSG